MPGILRRREWSVAYMPPRRCYKAFNPKLNGYKPDINGNIDEAEWRYQRLVPVSEINGIDVDEEASGYLLEEDKTPLSQRVHESVSLIKSPSYEKYLNGSNISCTQERRYEQEVRLLPGVPPVKHFSRSVYCFEQGKWYHEAVFIKLGIRPPKMFTTRVFIYPKQTVKSEVSSVEHMDEQTIRYYTVAMDIQLRDFVSLKLVPEYD